MAAFEFCLGPRRAFLVSSVLGQNRTRDKSERNWTYITRVDPTAKTVVTDEKVTAPLIEKLLSLHALVGNTPFMTYISAAAL